MKKRILVILMGIIVALLASGCSNNSNYYELGNDAFSNGEYVDAINYYKQCDLSDDVNEKIVLSRAKIDAVKRRGSIEYIDGALCYIDENNAFKYVGKCDKLPQLDWDDLIQIETAYSAPDSMEYGHMYLIGLKSDGTIVTSSPIEDWGICELLDINPETIIQEVNRSTEIIKKWSDIKEIYTSYSTVIGLKNDGSVLVSDGTKEIEADEYFGSEGWCDLAHIVNSVGIKNDGSLVHYCDLFSTNAKNTPPFNDEIKEQIVGLYGNDFPFILTSSGAYTAYSKILIDENVDLSNIVDVVTGEVISINDARFIAILYDDGTVTVCNDRKNIFQIAELDNVVALDFSGGILVAFESNGTIDVITTQSFLTNDSKVRLLPIDPARAPETHELATVSAHYNYEGETAHQLGENNVIVNHTNTNKCEECMNVATHTIINPFSGEVEYYCDEHYKEIMELIDYLENN